MKASEPDPPETLALGPTVAAALGEAVPGFFRTAWSLVPLIIALVALLIAALLVVLVAMGGLLAALTYGGQSVAVPAITVYVVVVLGVLPIQSLVLSPLLIALATGHWKHLRDDVDLSVKDGLRGGFSHWSLLLFTFVYLSAVTIGYALFLIPGLIIDALFGFVIPAVIVHDIPLGKAIQRSVSHFFKAPLWHIGLSLVDQVIGIAAGMLLPVVGGAAAVSLHMHINLRAYVQAFPADAAMIEAPLDRDSDLDAAIRS